MKLEQLELGLCISKEIDMLDLSIDRIEKFSSDNPSHTVETRQGSIFIPCGLFSKQEVLQRLRSRKAELTVQFAKL
ncbi:hypothetical protein [Bacteroides hominis]|uniref:hypothetical protein n=1 Tax=Bacteroides hominis TaxID=2763023 RepID=UPI00164BFACB|nr:hypothetical protein [Bacteroides hominis (ex Liu et al. 2022)]MBC5614287.1 hypothetical protein [Bacteroides hominis (ex Liu et al. 2022)]MCS2829708.1 hypothetical protein [Bacteroides fragilis]